MIQFKHVYKSYGEKNVLRDVSFSVREGTHFAPDGPSGSGKTTLLRLLLGLEKPDHGTISGTEDKKISCVFQEDRLIEPVSALKNITMFGISVPEAKRHLAAVGLADDTNGTVSAFSGGMKRRVAIARAVAVKPDILVLDEPFSGIDPDARKTVAAYILSECPNATVFLTTHEAGDRELIGIDQTYSL